jgi:hypothetical protein
VGQTELAVESEEFRPKVNERASERAGFIIALAKSRMLADYGEHESADAPMKPYFFGTAKQPLHQRHTDPMALVITALPVMGKSEFH